MANGILEDWLHFCFPSKVCLGSEPTIKTENEITYTVTFTFTFIVNIFTRFHLRAWLNALLTSFRNAVILFQGIEKHEVLDSFKQANELLPLDLPLLLLLPLTNISEKELNDQQCGTNCA